MGLYAKKTPPEIGIISYTLLESVVISAIHPKSPEAQPSVIRRRKANNIWDHTF